MAPQYKLSYFNSRGVAEPIRLMLAYAKVQYEDVRFEYRGEEWPKHKESMPWGQLPVLEVDGVQISQSKAIARYVAKKHGLAGETELEQAKSDEYVETLDDIRSESTKWWHETDEAKKVELKKTMEQEVLPRYFSKFEAIVKKHGSGFLVGKKVTYADIYLAHNVNQLGVLFPGFDLNKFPALKKHSEMILSLPSIKEWIERRPKTQF